jgi:SAM-dependent methyltransferase
VPLRDSGIQTHRDEGRRLFGLDPAGYRAGRPDYPEAVYETLVQRCGLGPTARVLEIGPGTGLVTQHLLRQGAHVTAVEPDRSMAPYLCDPASSANLDVVIASFEETDIPLDNFDLAVAATSFHWVDQEGWPDQTGASAETRGVGRIVVDTLPRSWSARRVQPGPRSHLGTGDPRCL